MVSAGFPLKIPDPETIISAPASATS